MSTNQFRHCAKFISDNKKEIKKYYSNDVFWNSIGWYRNHNCIPWISMDGFKSLVKCPCFNSYFMKIKRNELKQIDIPFCEHIFDDFINKRFISCYKRYGNKYELYYAGFYDEHNSMNPMKNVAMFYDKEYAYTQFYKLCEFQAYKPFVEYKKNHEERKERLLVVYEETYENYQNSNNTIEMIFSNEYLIMTILQFL